MTEEEFNKFQKSYESQVFRMRGIIERNNHLLYLQEKENKSMKIIKKSTVALFFIISTLISVVLSWLLLK